MSNAKKDQHTLSNCKGCYHHFAEIHKGTVLKDSTETIYNCVNKPFEKTFGVSFAETQTKVPELNLQLKPSKQEKKQEQGRIYMKMKSKIQNKWNETSVQR